MAKNCRSGDRAASERSRLRPIRCRCVTLFRADRCNEMTRQSSSRLRQKRDNLLLLPPFLSRRRPSVSSHQLTLRWRGRSLSPMTLKTKRYNSAPITEAVIEIRLQPSTTVAPAVLQQLAESLKADFPKQAPMQFLEMGVAQQPGQALQQSFSQSIVGVRLSKTDDSRILQIRHEGFAYSHMAPYTDWATFRAEAQPLWKRYREVFPEKKLTRCALRYINRIDIPEAKIELYDYFELYPKVPEALPQQDVIAMALNLQMPQTDLHCVANLAQALGEPVKAGHISFILDIDIFRLQIEDWNDEATWAFLEKLRDRKNEIFEACITNRTRKLIAR